MFVKIGNSIKFEGFRAGTPREQAIHEQNRIQRTFPLVSNFSLKVAANFLEHSFGAFFENQGALKGTNLRGQTEPKRRFSQIFADFCRFSSFPRNKAFGKRRFSQKTTDFRRKPQKTAGNRRKPQIGVCPLRFVPLSAALEKMSPFMPTRHGPCHVFSKLFVWMFCYLFAQRGEIVR